MLGVPDREKLRRLTETGQGAARAASKAAIDVAQAALREARAWDVFKWAVIGLLAANLLLLAFLYEGLRSDIAGLQQGRDDEAQDLRSEMTKEIADNKAELAQVISGMRSSFADEIAKINARVDELVKNSTQPMAAPVVQAPPKPIAKPGRRHH
jgi:hypothetical protein